MHMVCILQLATIQCKVSVFTYQAGCVCQVTMSINFINTDMNTFYELRGEAGALPLQNILTGVPAKPTLSLSWRSTYRL